VAAKAMAATTTTTKEKAIAATATATTATAGMAKYGDGSKDNSKAMDNGHRDGEGNNKGQRATG
jgi:hypothetical protein